MDMITHNSKLSSVYQFFINLYYRYWKGWGLFGDYPDWQSAERACRGYEDAAIIERVESAALSVQKGDARYERDGVLFHDNSEVTNLTKCLKFVADTVQPKESLFLQDSFVAGKTPTSREGRSELRVLDFGGSLGSLYFQHQRFLSQFEGLIWCVVEQAHFVDLGQKQFADARLRFAYTISEAVEKYQPTVVLFSSVLQYVEDTDSYLAEVARHKIPFIWIDRTAFWNGQYDRFLKQIVSLKIYKTSYPTRIFSLPLFKNKLDADYDILETFDSPDKMNVRDMQYLGFFARFKIEK
jgi:putative methyltransferase (TIGR04325 family)